VAATPEVPRVRNPLVAISNLTVQTMRDQTGRGPTKAKTYLNDDCAMVVVEGAMLPAERTLITQGDSETVVSMRRKFQQAMRAPLVEGVETITGRKVAAFLSDSLVDPDLSVETFIFEEEPDPAA
jgi:uncharacterized protein YbcI